MDFIGSKLGSGTTWKGARVATVCSTAAEQHHTPSSAAGEHFQMRVLFRTGIVPMIVFITTLKNLGIT